MHEWSTVGKNTDRGNPKYMEEKCGLTWEWNWAFKMRGRQLTAFVITLLKIGFVPRGEHTDSPGKDQTVDAVLGSNQNT